MISRWRCKKYIQPSRSILQPIKENWPFRFSPGSLVFDNNRYYWLNACLFKIFKVILPRSLRFPAG